MKYKIYEMIDTELKKYLPFKLKWVDREMEIIELRNDFLKIDVGNTPPKDRLSYVTGIREIKCKNYRTGELFGIDYDGICDILSTFLDLIKIPDISLKSFNINIMSCSEAIPIVVNYQKLIENLGG